MSAILLPYTYNCFVCGAANPAGLQLRFRLEEDEIRAALEPRPHHAGYRGIVHGGVVASVLDEAMFWAAAWPTRRWQASGEMSVRYSRPVAVGQPYRLVAVLEREQRRVCYTRGELRDAAGQVCASATGKFLPLRGGETPLDPGDFYPDPATVSPAVFFGTAGSD